MEKYRGRVLIIDDEPSIREVLSFYLQRKQLEVETAADGREGIEKLNNSEFDVVVTDLKMPGELDGLGVLRYIREYHPDTQVIIMTAFASTDTAIEAMKLGAYDYIEKPFNNEELNTLIGKCLEKRRLIQENYQLRNELQSRYQFDRLIGKSQVMQDLFELMKKAANSKLTVLITGESGTGKELVARALHYNGPRAKKPFVPINCGAIPEQLLESELFGHKKGAFTSADRDKIGLFQLADGGTIFLDEIGELPIHIQVKLLRVIQEKTVMPIGGTTEQKVDVRIICATNKNLAAEVKAGRFREDLFFRLNVLTIEVPPLRKRKEDIPLLAYHFLKKAAAEMEKDITAISPEALEVLIQYDYPGNVRELENIIERGVLLETEKTLRVESLPPYLLKNSPSSEFLPIPKSYTALPQVTVPQPLSLPEEGLEAYLDNVERQLLELALKKANGVKKEAAKLLKISLRSLRYRLQKHSID